MSDVTVLFSFDEGADEALGLPSYETAGAAGADLRASFPDRGSVTLAPGERALVPTGLRLAIPEGYEVGKNENPQQQPPPPQQQPPAQGGAGGTGAKEKDET